MSSTDPLAAARLVALIVGAVAAWGFCLSYHVVSHGMWRHNPHGVHAMVFTGCIGGIITYLLAYRAGVIPGHWVPAVSLTIYVVLACIILWQIVLLFSAKRNVKR